MLPIEEWLATAAKGLSPRDTLFMQRILGDGLQKYESRLNAIGFTGLGRVLDAGCGFGQWSLALSKSCHEVVGIDVDQARIEIAAKLGAGVDNVMFQTGSIDSLPFRDSLFDAIFSYSVIYYTDVAATIKELVRVLKPGGRIYICSNGLGWYIYNIIRRPNPSPDFDPRSYGLWTLRDSVRYHLFGTPPSRHGSVVTSQNYMIKLLDKNGVDVLATGAEGTLHLTPSATAPRPFFKGRYAGMQCCLEWVGLKRK